MSSKTMKVLRRSTEVGFVDLTTAKLLSTDKELNQLWNTWLTGGFMVLGPPNEEPLPGVLADALYTIRPAPDNLGLVAIELQQNGYELEFE
jgi:hypothetical protein